MPRKQRFKPSRKPKPIPQSEAAATIGRDPPEAAAQDATAHSDKLDATPGSSSARGEGPTQEPDTGSSSG